MKWTAMAGALVIALVFLRDPRWLADVSSGLDEWQQDEQHVEYRSMLSGRASFFISSDVTAIDIPLRGVSPSADSGVIVVQAAVNDLPVGQIVLSDGEWTSLRLLTARVPSHGRRHLRVDLHVPRVRADGTAGVRVGRPKTTS